MRVLAGLEAEVTAIDRIQPSERLPNAHVEWDGLRHLAQEYEADYLIHLSAVTNAEFVERYPIDTYEVNVLGTANLMNHVKINKLVLLPSTALTYEASRTSVSGEGPADLSSTYAPSKNMGEQVIKFHCNRMGVGHTVVRFFKIYGPGQMLIYIGPQALSQIKEHHHIEIKNGWVMLDPLFTDDSVNTVLTLTVTTAAEDNIFNFGSGHIVSFTDVAKAAI